MAAGILACQAKGPVHIGSDSKAFCDEANNLLTQIKPWGLICDGDIWGHFYLAAKKKDP